MIITVAICSLLPNAWSSFPRMLVYVIECCKLLIISVFIGNPALVSGILHCDSSMIYVEFGQLSK
jgi:hypothetical protein